GKSGIDIVREMGKQSCFKNIPILIMSGCVREPDADALLDGLTVAGYLSKFELVTSLVPRVQEILSKQVHRVA
ncbi:MAG: hypothetical protein O7A63_04445, partial [Acidobacteria bacterium]|nr:hypothetical protein [Acidobacteriota bacterium]